MASCIHFKCNESAAVIPQLQVEGTCHVMALWLCNISRQQTVMTENPLPISLYEGLFEKLVIVLELAQKKEGVVTPQAKQAILQAVRLVCYESSSLSEYLAF